MPYSINNFSALALHFRVSTLLINVTCVAHQLNVVQSSKISFINALFEELLIQSIKICSSGESGFTYSIFVISNMDG